MTKEIWVRNYINPKNDYHEDPLYFTIIDDRETIIPQNNKWKPSAYLGIIASIELSGWAQDRKLKEWEIIKLKLQGVI